MKNLVLLIILLSSFSIWSQINMGNLGTVTNGCGQTFYDSGGSGGDYGSSQNFTASFCAPAGQYITFNFTQFNLGSGDNLKIYNGPNTGSPLIGTYTSNGPGQVSSSLGGCLTFVFTSNAPILFITSNGPGWTAAITCGATVPPPPPPAPGTCAAAQPFCTSSGVNYPAAVGTSSESGPTYGCLTTQPSPGWFYLNIATAGNIRIDLSNTNTNDIDFAIWGPFASQAAMCAGTTANPIDCSYSTAATEQVDIPNAKVGEWYILVITNYEDTPTNIIAVAGDASGVDGTTNCNILCNMTSLTATPGACSVATNSFTLNGTIDVQYPPSSGTLTVTSSCGGSVTIPTPWNSPIAYSIPNIPANGAACTVTASFSADPTCSLTQNYTAPAACNPTCIVSSLGATPTACLSGSLYDVSGSVAFSNAPATGTLAITNGCGGSQVFNAPFTSPLNYTLSGLTANGAACTVTASFSADAACTLTQNYTAPAACAPSCLISNLDAIPGTCSTGDVYDLSGSVSFSNAPSTGTLTVSGSCGGSQVFNAPFVSPLNYNFIGLNANGVACTVTASFSDDVACTRTQNYVAPAPCTPGCIISSVITTPGTCMAGDVYDLSGSISFNNAPSTGTLTVSNSCGGSQVFNAPFVSPLNYNFAGLTANGLSCTVTASFSDETTCNRTQNYTAPASCASCIISTLTAAPTNCNSSNLYGVSGTVTFVDAPSTGTLTISGSCGGSQTFNAPFVSPLNYQLNGMIPDGATCTVTASFSDEACTLSQNYVAPSITANFIADTLNGCIPLTVQFTNLSAGSTNCVWDFGNGISVTDCNSITVDYLTTGCFNVSLRTSNAMGCVASNTISNYICTETAPDGSFNTIGNEFSTINNLVTFVNNTTGTNTYYWNFGDGSIGSNQENPQHQYPYDPGSYSVMLVTTTPAGCVDTTYGTVTIFEELIYYVPNTFTPDGDNFNQTFKPVFTSGFDPFDYTLSIYNRWGELVFESNNALYGWDGSYGKGAEVKSVQEGIYTWKIEFKTNRNDERKMATGHVSILR